ncbi:hypothetical protein PPYR_14404 [Photinus pyralis]|uniref:Peptidase S1 domain-containing protein n=2 Tax=Photinus pyralis TaxID=7054 RepID=A0A5N4A547_PHOPY|nr:chymotrypsin-1-like [Photinus pyralis]KAB0792445.1 hypothetical protein PPYR_14404 [Photinus pyralis]
MKLLLVVLLATGASAAPHRDLAPEGAYPHQVSLKFLDVHSCGGSIIDETTILTAAHCVQSLIPEFTSVIVGTNHLHSGGHQYAVTKILPHDRYDPILVKNDIALVTLERPIEFNGQVRPIELETEHVGGGVDCVVSGWMSGEDAESLQHIKLKTIESVTCATFLIDDTQICAKSAEERAHCSADSGNPLVTDKQIGIASFGSLCNEGSPDVYTRVSAYERWIEKSKR